MTLRVQDEEVSFNIFKAISTLSNNDESYYINIVDKVTTKTFEKETATLPLDACIYIQPQIRREF